MKKSFNIQELFAPQVQTSWNQAHAPLSSRAFQRHQEHNLKHSNWVDLKTTKQNKLPSFIDRLKNSFISRRRDIEHFNI
jgi:hypothetical protein